MSERDLGWVLPHGEAKELDRVRVNGRWFYAKRQWTPTSMSFYSEADTTILREVYVNGERFVRAPKRDYDMPDVMD